MHPSEPDALDALRVADLLEAGWSRRFIMGAVHDGRLMHLRTGSGKKAPIVVLRKWLRAFLEAEADRAEVRRAART